MKHVTAFVLGIVLVATLGCENRRSAPASATTGTVGVVTLDDVAKAMGWLGHMENVLNAQKQDMDVKIAGYKTSIESTIEAQRKKFGATPSADDKQQLDRMVASGNYQLAGAQNQERQIIAQMQAQMAGQYRDLIRPVARRIATQRGLSIVLTTQSDQMISFDPAVDLTQAVIDELQKNPPRDPVLDLATSQPAEAPKTTPGK